VGSDSEGDEVPADVKSDPDDSQFLMVHEYEHDDLYAQEHAHTTDGVCHLADEQTYTNVCFVEYMVDRYALSVVYQYVDVHAYSASYVWYKVDIV